MATAEQRAARRRAFRDLHQSGCFVIPNPWDIGSALYLQRLVSGGPYLRFWD